MALFSALCDVNDISHLFPVIMDSGKGRILQLSKTTTRSNFLDFFDPNLNLRLWQQLFPVVTHQYTRSISWSWDLCMIKDGRKIHKSKLVISYELIYWFVPFQLRT